MVDTQELRHSLINNSLRIEILNKLMIDSIDQEKAVNEEQKEDLILALQKHITILENL